MRAQKINTLYKIYNQESAKMIMLSYIYAWNKLMEASEDTLGWDDNLTVRI